MVLLKGLRHGSWHVGSQEHRISYEDTFSAVVKWTTIQIFLAIKSSKQWDLWQMDVNNRFLYEDLDHVIHMEQPNGFKREECMNYVCKLNKYIYDLKQSLRAWFRKIAEFLELNGFKIMNIDASLFLKHVNDRVVVVPVYMDDIIITGDVLEEITQLKSNMCIHFRMKDLGRLSRFLVLELEYSNEGILQHQKKYASDVVQTFGILNSKLAPTPMNSGTKLYAHLGKDVEDLTTYRKMVGNLIYLTLIHLVISFVIGVVSHYMQNPK